MWSSCKSPKLGKSSESAPRVFLQKTILPWVNLMNTPTNLKVHQRLVFVKDMAGMWSDDPVMNDEWRHVYIFDVLPCLFQDADPRLKIPRPTAPTTTRGALFPAFKKITQARKFQSSKFLGGQGPRELFWALFMLRPYRDLQTVKKDSTIKPCQNILYAECLVMFSDHKVSGGNAADGKRILVSTPGLTTVAA